MKKYTALVNAVGKHGAKGYTFWEKVKAHFQSGPAIIYRYNDIDTGKDLNVDIFGQHYLQKNSRWHKVSAKEAMDYLVTPKNSDTYTINIRDTQAFR